MAQSTFTNVSIEEGLDLILSHLEPPYFPRRIATKMTDNHQILVHSRKEALEKYIGSSLRDCEISAYQYPIPTIRGINTQMPNFVDIDLDLKNFNTCRALDQCLQHTLDNCRLKLGASPTVLWSGGGYHIHLSLDVKDRSGNDVVLEMESIFREFDKPFDPVSRKFMLYIEKLMTNNRSDPNHNAAVGNCMIRLPGSYNSKYKDKNGNLIPRSKVCIVKSWDGNRSNAGRLLQGFWDYLIQERNNEALIRLHNEQRMMRRGTRYDKLQFLMDQVSYIWVEKLLEKPLGDYRKGCIRFILVPYFLNIKHLSDSDTEDRIYTWLDKCASVCRLDSSIKYRVKYSIKEVRKLQDKGKFVVPSLEKVRMKSPPLYELLRKERVI